VVVVMVQADARWACSGELDNTNVNAVGPHDESDKCCLPADERIGGLDG
jgi:hypothetical protein